MIQNNFKLKASALLISMVIGVIVSATLFGLVASTNQYLKTSVQSRDGAIAYQAAISGIEDGVLRYKVAAGQNKLNLIYRKFDQETPGTFQRFTLSDNAYYNLSIRADSIAIGTNTTSVNWYNDATNALAQKAMPLKTDDTFEIDLSYFLKLPTTDLSSLKIQFSSPFIKSNGSYSRTGLISGYFTALNFQLINFSERGEQQIVAEDINKTNSNHELTVSNLTQCATATASCRLRITPRVVKTGNIVTGRLSGGQVAGVLADKYVFVKVVATNDGEILSPAEYPAGSIVIESIGASGDAKRKLRATIDLSSGRYMGIFDYGVYCGDKCVMP